MGEDESDLQPAESLAYPDSIYDQAWREVLDAPPGDLELGTYYAMVGAAANAGREYTDYSTYLQNPDNRAALVDSLIASLGDKGESYRSIFNGALEALADGSTGLLPDPWQVNIGEGADPVFLASGELVLVAEDLRINGAGIDFVFRRTYRNQAVFAGPLGANWDHGYNMRLREAEGEVVLTSGDLREQRFRLHPLHDYFVPPDGVDAIVRAQGASFVRRAVDGTRHLFAPDPTAGGVHRLDRIEDRFGRFLQFHYRDEEGSPLDRVVVNHPARVVRFDYDEQRRIVAVADYTGRTWRYGYDDLNNLVAVVTPATDQFPAGLATSYEYTTDVAGLLQHNLRRVTDASGRLYLENEYGETTGRLDFNRVVRQRQAGGDTLFEYEVVEPVFARDYPDAQRPTTATTVTERNGQRVYHVFNRFGNPLSREECILERGRIRRLVEHYRYNRDGQLTGALSPEGVLTQYEYGREAFLRRHGIADEDALATHDELTPEARLAFGRLLTTVRRAQRFDLFATAAGQGIWGDFPDIIGGFDSDDADIIVKMTYEPDYGQVLTASDPRFTRSAAHDAIQEHPRHVETLTRYVYDGPSGDPNRFLVEIRRPAPTGPDGVVGAPVVERFKNEDGSPGYDGSGRPVRRTSARGVVTELRYVAEDANAPRSGYLATTVVDPGGLAVTTGFVVDALGRVTATRLPRGAGATDDAFVRSAVYDELDQLVEMIGVPPFRFRTRRTYDRSGRMVRLESPLLDEEGQPILGGLAVQRFQYDEELKLVAESTGGIGRSPRLVTRHRYDGAGLRRLTILPGGNLIAYRHDARQLRRATIQGFGTSQAATTRQEYDGDRRVRRSVDPRGHATTYTHDPFGRTVAEENALGHVVRRDYDKLGHEVCQRFFERRDDGYVLLARNETEYDELGRAIRHGVNRFPAPLGPVPAEQLADAFRASPGPGELLTTLVFYDAGDLAVRRVDALGRTTTFEYDALGRLTVTTDPTGTRVENAYDAHDNLVRRDRLEAVLDPTNGAVVGQRAFAEEYEYDQLDRLVASRDSLGNTSRYAYDSRGNRVLAIDPLGRVERTEYDLFNRRVAIRHEPPPGDPTPARVTRLEYDRNGNLIAVVDAHGRRTRHRYDALDRPTATIYPDGTEARLAYDADSHLVETVDANGLRKRMTVDPLGRTVRVDVDRTGLPVGLTVEGATVCQYVFDGLNRPIRESNDFADRELTHNSLGWLERETIRLTGPAPLNRDLTIEREFDAAGAVVGLTYPEGRRLRLTRDPLDRVTNVQNLALGAGYPGSPATPANAPIAVFAYAGRQLGEAVAGNGVATGYHYDGAGRPVAIVHDAGGPAALAIQYLYDGGGQVRLRHDLTAAVEPAERFINDRSGWLVDARTEVRAPFDPGPLAPPPNRLPRPLPDRQAAIDTLAGGAVTGGAELQIAYDDVGNREREVRAGAGVVEYEVNALDQYVECGATTMGYDGNGNLVDDGMRRYVYDADDQLVRVVDTASGTDVARFFHDAQGRRVLEIVGNTAIHLLWDGDEVLAEYRAGQVARQYVHGDGVDAPLQIAADGAEHWCHADLGGSIRRLTGSTGGVTASYRYDPFGVELEAAGPAAANLLRYCGRRLDAALGSYDYRARQYDPRLGRFLQRDPAGMLDGTNLYAYADNDPIRFGDHTGLGRTEFASTMDEGPQVGLIGGRTYVGATGLPWRYQDGTLTYAGDDGRGYCFDRSWSAGAFGWRIRDPGNTGPPRSKYNNFTAAEHALRGEYNMAEIAEAEQACFYCHVQKTYGRTPSDDQFDLRAVNDDVLFWTSVQMQILMLPLEVTSLAGVTATTATTTTTTTRAATVSTQAARTTANASRRLFQKTPLWRKLSRTFWENRKNFSIGKDFFKRYRRIFRNQAGAAPKWSMEHLVVKQRWIRGANPWFRPGTWQAKALQGLGDAGWNLVPLPHRFNSWLYRHPVVSAGFSAGVYYGSYKLTEWSAGQVYEAGQGIGARLSEGDGE